MNAGYFKGILTMSFNPQALVEAKQYLGSSENTPYGLIDEVSFLSMLEFSRYRDTKRVSETYMASLLLYPVVKLLNQVMEIEKITITNLSEMTVVGLESTINYLKEHQIIYDSDKVEILNPEENPTTDATFRWDIEIYFTFSEFKGAPCESNSLLTCKDYQSFAIENHTVNGKIVAPTFLMCKQGGDGFYCGDLNATLYGEFYPVSPVPVLEYPNPPNHKNYLLPAILWQVYETCHAYSLNDPSINWCISDRLALDAEGGEGAFTVMYQEIVANKAMAFQHYNDMRYLPWYDTEKFEYYVDKVNENNGDICALFTPIRPPLFGVDYDGISFQKSGFVVYEGDFKKIYEQEIKDVKVSDLIDFGIDFEYTDNCTKVKVPYRMWWNPHFNHPSKWIATRIYLYGSFLKDLDEVNGGDLGIYGILAGKMTRNLYTTTHYYQLIMNSDIITKSNETANEIANEISDIYWWFWEGWPEPVGICGAHYQFNAMPILRFFDKRVKVVISQTEYWLWKIAKENIPQKSQFKYFLLGISSGVHPKFRIIPKHTWKDLTPIDINIPEDVIVEEKFFTFADIKI